MGRKLLRAGKWTLFLLGTALALSPFGFMILAHRAEARLQRALNQISAVGRPVKAVDLARPPAPDYENAALVYRQAFEALALSGADTDFVADACRGNGSLTDPAVAARARRILDQNARALSLLRRAAAMPQCDWGYDWSRGLEVLCPELGRLKNCSRLLALDSLMSLHGGRGDEALETFATNLRLADAADEPVMIGQLVRYAIIAIASRSLNTILREARPSESVCLAVGREISDIELTSAFIAALEGERAIGIWAFDHVRSAPDPFKAVGEISSTNGGLAPGSLAPGVTGRPHAAIIRWWLASDELSYLRLMGLQIAQARLSSHEVVSLRPSAEDELDKLATLRRPAPPAVLTVCLVPMFTKAHLRRDQGIAWLGADQIALLLKAYRAHHGAYPESLEPLTHFVDRPLPLDPFSGKPFRYERRGAGFIVYSIGRNLKDDGGTPRPPPTKQPPGKPIVYVRKEGAEPPPRPDDIVIECTR